VRPAAGAAQRTTGGVAPRATVVGGGVIGLTTAIRLLEAGWRVDVVTADPVEGTTSYLAAAVWFPTHAGPPGRVRAWSARTYQVLHAQALDAVPGVVLRESLTLAREPMGEPDWAAAVGVVRPAEAAELPPGYRHGLRYVVPLVEMPVHLPWLVSQVFALGGSIRTQRLRSLTELGHERLDVVVNCSGLGARDLVGDLEVHPVRGQIVRVANPGLTLSVRDEHHPGGRAYVHPRRDDCILGGTLEVGSWDRTPDPQVAESILRRCRDICPALGEVRVLGHAVGLRPGRSAVRLELTTAELPGVPVVHNYGHGGSGVTLAWGCAEDVVRLLSRLAA
jgi:D-amino-acid oxidase